MKTSLRSIVLAATVVLTAAPALHADVMGTNPRPTRTAPTPSVAQRLLSFFGF